MAKSYKKTTFARFIFPVSLIIFSIVIMNFEINISYLEMHQVNTIGFGLFTVSAFSLIIIMNHSRNPFVTRGGSLLGLTRALIVYAGIFTVAYYEQIFLESTLTFAVCVLLFVGIIAPLILDSASVRRNQVIN